MLAKRSLGSYFDTSAATEENESLILVWELTVNQNERKLENGARVVDVLEPGLSYISESTIITWYDGDVLNSRPLVGVVTEANIDGYIRDEVTFTIPGDLNNQRIIIKFETRVDTNAISAFRTNVPQVPISNEARLLNGDYTAVPATGSANIQNRVLSKTGSFDRNLRIVSYRVNVNPMGLTLDNTVELTDIIPYGLRMDIDSLRLVEATVDENGVFHPVKDGKTWDLNEGFPHIFNLSKINQEILPVQAVPPIPGIPGRSGELIVRPPVTTESDLNRFILTYDCFIYDSSNPIYNNSISITGTGTGGVEGSSAVPINIGLGGGGVSSRSARSNCMTACVRVSR
jgi:uncharacterized surface anchored protein